MAALGEEAGAEGIGEATEGAESDEAEGLEGWEGWEGWDGCGEDMQNWKAKTAMGTLRTALMAKGMRKGEGAEERESAERGAAEIED